MAERKTILTDLDLCGNRILNVFELDIYDKYKTYLESNPTEVKTFDEFCNTLSYYIQNLSKSGNGKRFLSDDGTYKELTSEDITLETSSALSFYCIEPVTVTIGSNSTTYEANSFVTVYPNGVDFTITPTSDNSIMMLTSWPGALGEFYSWLEGVMVFANIIFDMNDLAMYEKWNQGHQGQYHVQFAQYINCVFWSDNAYVSDVAERTNYTLYNSSQLPLCYSTIPDNTFKSFYCAYGVTSDPNWSNQAYKDSFAKATWATQVFSYYGLHSIGMFDMDASYFNITLPKDCRGLMFYAPNILNAGVFDAVNVTNFGSRSGSWRDAFGYCYQLSNLYIKNLKVDINVSWSPISQEALIFILENAANTKAISLYLSPYTYYRISDDTKELALEKNINLILLEGNYADDTRWNNKPYVTKSSTFPVTISNSVSGKSNYPEVIVLDSSGSIVSAKVTYTSTSIVVESDLAEELTIVIK